MNKKEYQVNELKRFQNQKDRFFDTVKEFDKNLSDMDFDEQIEWIENGSYGAGACFELQRVLKNLTKRMNANAQVGNVVLKAFYGADFRYFRKLSSDNQQRLNQAVTKWIARDHEFPQELEA